MSCRLWEVNYRSPLRSRDALAGSQCDLRGIHILDVNIAPEYVTFQPVFVNLHPPAVFQV
jgi:hypothetical protein